MGRGRWAGSCLDEDMSDRDIEPEIAEAVQSVANRYGARGLEDLIVLAEQELVATRRALEELAPDTD